jgi:dTDP-4-amino-4,6-dideoxygalactose transaminase
MVTKSFLPPINEYKKKLDSIWERSWLTNQGPLHEQFNREILEYLGVGNATLFVNGHLALETALKTLIPDRTGEVITTPFTFASTVHAIVNCGLTPVFCDINKDNFTIDSSKIESLITPKTVAILPVHVFGNPCDVYTISKIAHSNKLKLIYDAAHVFGVKIAGQGIGSFGDVSMFSLHATKVFNSIEGGVLTYSDRRFKPLFDLHKNFGITGPESVEYVGTNAKMNEFQAAMGLVNLPYLDNQIAKRKRIVESYRVYLDEIVGLSFVNDMDNITHNYSYFPILVEESTFGLSRDQLHSKLMEMNIFSRKYFYPLVSDYQCYHGQFHDNDLPIAKKVSEEVLTLPLYGDLELAVVKKICDIIKQVHLNAFNKK